MVGVLLHFREESIAVTGDTEAMFHQVKVPEQQKKKTTKIYFGGKIVI